MTQKNKDLENERNAVTQNNKDLENEGNVLKITKI